MAWAKSISLDVANKLFDVIGVSFEQNELEGGYVAKHEDKTEEKINLNKLWGFKSPVSIGRKFWVGV
jgi:hypothetical protein